MSKQLYAPAVVIALYSPEGVAGAFSEVHAWPSKSLSKGVYRPPAERADRSGASALSCERTTRTGQGAWRMTPSEMLPSIALLLPRQPRQPITLTSGASALD